MKTKVLQKLFALLGFSTVASSCELIEGIGGGGMVCMYGCPSADYVFDVDVADKESDEPIEGIRVSVLERGQRQYWDSETGMATYEPYCDTLAVEHTGADGKTTLHITQFPAENHEVVFDDVDGVENGGEYASAAVEVVTKDGDYKEPGNSGWYEGTATHQVAVKLSKKSE